MASMSTPTLDSLSQAELHELVQRLLARVESQDEIGRAHV
jgi:hypothetical protein